MPFYELLESLPAGGVHRLMDRELVDMVAQKVERPAVPANLGDLRIRQRRRANSARFALVRRAGRPGVVKIVPSLVRPKNDRRADMKSFAANDDRIACLGRRFRRSGSVRRLRATYCGSQKYRQRGHTVTCQPTDHHYLWAIKTIQHVSSSVARFIHVAPPARCRSHETRYRAGPN